jgi:hypothetical protein
MPPGGCAELQNHFAAPQNRCADIKIVEFRPKTAKTNNHRRKSP